MYVSTRLVPCSKDIDLTPLIEWPGMIVSPPLGRSVNDRVFKRLGRVQSWKKLYHKLEYGVADRPLNFNQVKPCAAKVTSPS